MARRTDPDWDAFTAWHDPVAMEQRRRDHIAWLGKANSKRMRAEGERSCIVAAGGDPDAVRGKDREALITEGRRIKAQEKARKQAAVKRLHGERLRSAMPPWADKGAMQAIYDEAARLTAETGTPHEVDHIEPLLGENASGLHVHYNLRVVTRTENRRKGNRRVTA